MWMLVLRGVIAGIVVAVVVALSSRSPRWGAFVLTLPIISIIAFVMVWFQQRNLGEVSRLARETLILVPLGLPFFIPLAFAEKLGLRFSAAFIFGLVLASITIGLWMWLGPSQ